MALRTSGERTTRPAVCHPIPRSQADVRLRVETIESEAGMASIDAEWNGLYELCGSPTPCASHAWAQAWWGAYGSEGSGLYVLAFRDGCGDLVGIVPFVEDRPASPFHVRRLRVLGYLGEAGTFDMTEEPSLLLRPGLEARILAATVDALRTGFETGRWDVINLRIHQSDDVRAFETSMDEARDRAFVKLDAREGSDYADLPDSWAALRKALTRSMRDNLAYYPRLLTRDGHDWQVRMLESPGEMAAACRRLTSLHRARAESGKGPRHHVHIHGPIQEAFLADLLRRFAATGNATVAELLIDGEVVASGAFLRSGDTLTVSYSGYGEAWYKYSPIFVIDSAVFKVAIERGVRRLNFLRGPAPWKSRWGAETGPRMRRARLLSRHPSSLFRYALYSTVNAARRNVIEKLPNLGSRRAALRTALERLLVPALPVIRHVGLRVAPTMHWAAVQAPLHHR